MPSDTIPSCPIPLCGGAVVETWYKTRWVHYVCQRCGYQASGSKQREEAFKAHATLCALVERGRAKFAVLEYAQLASKLLAAREERDQAIREFEALAAVDAIVAAQLTWAIRERDAAVYARIVRHPVSCVCSLCPPVSGQHRENCRVCRQECPDSAAIARAVAEETRRCAKAVCELCALGYPLEWCECLWEHRDHSPDPGYAGPVLGPCKAGRIGIWGPPAQEEAIDAD